MNRLHIFLPLTTAKLVKKEAQKLGIPVSELIRRAIQQYLVK